MPEHTPNALYSVIRASAAAHAARLALEERHNGSAGRYIRDVLRLNKEAEVALLALESPAPPAPLDDIIFILLDVLELATIRRLIVALEVSMPHLVECKRLAQDLLEALKDTALQAADREAEALDREDMIRADAQN